MANFSGLHLLSGLCVTGVATYNDVAVILCRDSDNQPRQFELYEKDGKIEMRERKQVQITA